MITGYIGEKRALLTPDLLFVGRAGLIAVTKVQRALTRDIVPAIPGRWKEEAEGCGETCSIVLVTRISYPRDSSQAQRLFFTGYWSQGRTLLTAPNHGPFHDVSTRSTFLISIFQASE